MNKTIATIACTLVAPLAFAQTSTTTTQETTTASSPSTSASTTEETTTASSPSARTSTTTESTTYSSGTVTTYQPGKTVVVQSPQGPLSFALGTAARIVDGAGKIVTAPLRAGQKVRVYYNGTGDTRTVDHVVVED